MNLLTGIHSTYIYSVCVLNITTLIINLMLFFRLEVNAANMNDKSEHLVTTKKRNDPHQSANRLTKRHPKTDRAPRLSRKKKDNKSRLPNRQEGVLDNNKNQKVDVEDNSQLNQNVMKNRLLVVKKKEISQLDVMEKNQPDVMETTKNQPNVMEIMKNQMYHQMEVNSHLDLMAMEMNK